MRRTVEGGILRVVHVGRNRTAHAKKEIVLYPVRRYAKMQAFRSYRLGQVPDDITMRPHLGRCPVAQPTVVHGKTVMMLCHRHHILGSGFLEQLGPGRRIEVFCFEHRDEVLIPELVLGTVSGNVVLVHLRSSLVHISRIPLVAERRNRIDTPMNKNAELRILVPRRYLILLKRFPVRPERPLMIDVLDLFQEGGAFSVVLAAGLLPCLVNAVRIL